MSWSTQRITGSGSGLMPPTHPKKMGPKIIVSSNKLKGLGTKLGTHGYKASGLSTTPLQLSISIFLNLRN